MTRRHELVRPAAIAVLVGATACFAGAAVADGNAATARLAKRQAAASPGWVEPARTKANGSGIRVRYAVPSNLQPGQPAVVRIELSNVTADDARVDWRVPADVAATARGGGGAGMALPRGQVTVLELDVTPSADGMTYLDVFTRQNGRGSAQSVPLKVGSGRVALKREGVVQVTPSGERVLSLPSQAK